MNTTNQHKKEVSKIPPEKYRKILRGIELKNILLSSLKADINHELISEGMKINIKDDATYEIKNDEFVVKNKYSLSARNSDNKTVLKIESVFIIVFVSKEEITEEFFEIYKNLSLPLNVWPFFRELVNSITSRMNIPPLTLPLLKR
jgi:preprotein translocase subunit SecB